MLDALPGIREGVAAFGVFLALEQVFKAMAPPAEAHHSAAAAHGAGGHAAKLEAHH